MALIAQTPAQLLANGEGTVLVAQKATDGYIDNVIGFISSFMKGEPINGKELTYGGGTVLAAAVLGGGYFGRSRALAGKEPIAGFIL